MIRPCNFNYVLSNWDYITSVYISSSTVEDSLAKAHKLKKKNSLIMNLSQYKREQAIFLEYSQYKSSQKDIRLKTRKVDY